MIFEAKRVDDGRWAAGGYAEFEGKAYIVILYKTPEVGKMMTGLIEVEPDTIKCVGCCKRREGDKHV